MKISPHCRTTFPRYRTVGIWAVKTDRRLLSMYDHRLCISFDLWWVTLYVDIDWSTYV